MCFRMTSASFALSPCLSRTGVGAPVAAQVLTVLSGVAQSAYKMCGDVRLLANLKEVEEPFAKTQVRLFHHIREEDLEKMDKASCGCKQLKHGEKFMLHGLQT